MIKKSDDAFPSRMVQRSTVQILEDPKFLIDILSLGNHDFDGDVALKPELINGEELSQVRRSLLSIAPQPNSPITSPAKLMNDLVPPIFESVTQVDWMITTCTVAFQGLSIYFTEVSAGAF